MTKTVKVLCILLSSVFVFSGLFACSNKFGKKEENGVQYTETENSGDVGWDVKNVKSKIPDTAVNIFRDAKFKKGINVLGTSPAGEGRTIKGYLDYFGTASVVGMDYSRLRPWELTQWYSKQNISGRDTSTDYYDETTGEYVYRNDYKMVKFNPEKGSATLDVNCSAEYGTTAKTIGDWAHLLLEQNIERHYLRDVKSISAYIDYKIDKMDNMHLDGSYDKNKHAAQFVWYLSLASLKGGVIWFGIMVYDNRMDAKRGEAPGFNFRGGYSFDKGTNMVMYHIDPYNVYGREGVTTGKNYKLAIPLDKDLKFCIEQATKDGVFGVGTTLNDCYFSYTNLGWELPGTFDVSLTINRIGLYADLK